MSVQCALKQFHEYRDNKHLSFYSIIYYLNINLDHKINGGLYNYNIIEHYIIELFNIKYCVFRCHIG